MSFTFAMLLKPFAFLAAIAALASLRRLIERVLPDSKLKRVLLLRV